MAAGRGAAAHAVSACDIALWDLKARLLGLPLASLFGRVRERVEIYGSGGFTSYDDARLHDQLAGWVGREGVRRAKIKIGTDHRKDVDLVRLLRDELGYDFELRVDLNQAWTTGTAKRILRQLEPFDLQYAEQPLLLTELDASADLRHMTSVPIALDESAYTTQDVLEIVRRKAADVILVDPHEAGGLLPCKKACAIAEAAGVPVNVHSASELGVSTAAYLHLAASTPNMLYAIDTQYQHLTDDVITTPFAFHRGALTVPEGPGLGVELDPSKVERYRSDELALPYLRPDDPAWFSAKPEY